MGLVGTGTKLVQSLEEKLILIFTRS